ncbi:uncharacterized protein LOC129907139 isoform X2 [Episyrphus balteatus]|uniref:uncharacterized protein LOC129907139 isoform X2 n=1 Tax=Episyrphus balteatus TaxID=286459 RepID=UPI002485D791|nr:uncharacterized protein LOC129907139 isoform X2 [Episyrphus balteatus]
MSSDPSTPKTRKHKASETSSEQEEKQRLKTLKQQNMILANVSLEDLNKMLDERFKDLPTKKFLEPVLNELSQLRECNNQLQTQVRGLEMKYEQLERRFEISELQLREQNIIFHLPATNNEDPKERLQNTCSNLTIAKKNVTFEHFQELSTKTTKSKIFRVKLENGQLAREILSQGKLLANSGISMHKDFPIGMRHRRSILLKVRREVKQQNPELRVNLMDDRLHIQDHCFTWNDSRERKFYEKQ